jgi:DNA-binding NarL/FixJ family response regulator
MPLINGIEAARQIRARVPNTEVFIFSVHCDDQLMQKCLEAGHRAIREGLHLAHERHPRFDAQPMEVALAL